ncbi:MAG: ParB/RepB/Spo0J family partition protein [Clostridia bacterium]|nr:ParB/RepB/Spo0J family partition protein [Clostridia bacterium]
MAAAKKKGGLGTGFDTLFINNAVEELSSAAAVKLKILEITPNKEQPRKKFNEEELTALAESIRSHGVLQPLLVRPMPDGSYQLVAGERRWRAARAAGLSEVPAVIKEMTDEDAAVFALVENLQRADLNPVEEAQGMRRLMEDYNLTQEQVSEKVGKSRPAVANALRLLKLPATVLGSVAAGELSAGHARALAALDDDKTIVEAAREIIAKKLSVRQTEALVKSLLAAPKKKAGKKTAKIPFYDEVELSLRDTLHRKVKISGSGKKEGGTLEIDFYNNEDLAAIARVLGQLED